MPPTPRRPRIPRVRKQLLAVVDSRTTMVCLDAAGQIREADEPFDTLMGELAAPPFHIHCRSTVVPWIAGQISEQRDAANAETQARPIAEKRKSPDGYMGSLPPPVPASAAVQVMRGRPADVPAAPGARIPSRFRDDITEWSSTLARLTRTERARTDDLRDPVLDVIAHTQGFTARPRVVSAGQLSRLISRGFREVWRGDTADHAEDLRTGAYVATAGIYAAGLQFHTDPEAAGVFADPVLLRAALVPEARTITWDDLTALIKDVEDRLTASQRRRYRILLSDPGRFAAALGYDAILLPDGGVIVLNRTALVVAR